ncbi:MAG: monovalent cation/H(+) antiporter subunit G [bacterium]
MIIDIIVVIFLLLGSIFMLIASIGIIRLPDLYMRIHASTKTTTLGILLLLTGACIMFVDFWVIVKALVIIIYIFLTTPISSHMISSAAHQMDIPKWVNTIRDDLKNKKD